MEAKSATAKPVILLLGNYPLDRQESMLRFRDLLAERLAADGYTVESISPEAQVGHFAGQGGAAKWFGYVDKYVIFPLGLLGRFSSLREKYLGRKIVVHICDHSNAVYAMLVRRWFPTLVTCHDLLAVRGALGEDTDCPASGFGQLLQKEILHGLGRAHEVICVSKATRDDLVRLGGKGEMAQRSEVLPLALNYAYGPMSRGEALAVLARSEIEVEYGGYVLHVGSGLKRKNRTALLLSVAKIKDAWPGKIVFAGEPLSEAEREQARALGLAGRVREIKPDNATLHALYGAAHALIFMSRAEGFGWPILEAQASGCPVICSNRTSVPEVAGEGALVHEPDACDAIAADIQRLQDPVFRDKVIALGLKNVQGYSIERMMRGYEDVYRRI